MTKMAEKFRGSYKAKIDERGRIKIPSKYLNIFQQYYDNNEVYITSLNGDRALLYPIKVWEEIEQAIAQSKVREQSIDRFVRLTSYWGNDNDIDQRGRILIQTELRQSGQLNDQVLLVGKFDHIEIWNNETFVSKFRTDEFTDEEMDKVSGMIGRFS